MKKVLVFIGVLVLYVGLIYSGTISPTSDNDNNLTQDEYFGDRDTIYNEFNGNIDDANLKANAVTTSEIQDDAVTGAKILDTSDVTVNDLTATYGITGSTITVSTITVTNVMEAGTEGVKISTSNASTPQTNSLYSNNIPKAWGRINMTVPSIVSDFNVESITDNGTGNFTIVLSTGFANDEYCIVGSCKDGFTAVEAVYASSFTIRTYDHANTLFDSPLVCFTVFGEQN